MKFASSEVAALVAAVSGATMRPAEIFAYSRWSGIAEPGDADAGRLIAKEGPERALALVESDFAETALGPDYADALARWLPRIRQIDPLLHLRQAARFGMKLIVPGMEAWPTERFAALGDHSPFALWARGNIELLQHPKTVAIVGARAATGYGEHVTIEIASGLVDRGICIVSGAAFGIDGAAHRAALASRGATIAVLASGADRFYPSGHETLLTRIVDHGLVVSEVPPGTAPTKWRFLQRNRLIAAIGDATVVVEAGWRSGSLNTAGHAFTMGRPLGAVPGPITSSASAGCHRLIREYDATCVTTALEIAELVGDPNPTEPLLAGMVAGEPLAR